MLYNKKTDCENNRFFLVINFENYKNSLTSLFKNPKAIVVADSLSNKLPKIVSLSLSEFAIS